MSLLALPLWIAALTVAAALVVVIALLLRPHVGASTVTRVTLVLAIVSAAVSAIGAVVTTLVIALQSQVEITIPIAPFWPELPPGATVEGASAQVLSGAVLSADVLADDLSGGARAAWAIAQGLSWLVPGSVAALVAFACRQLLAGRPFAPVVARLTMVVAAVVMVGGSAAAVLGDIAGSMASQELLGWTSASWSGDVDPTTQLLAPAFRLELPLWPIGAGLALAALAAVFRRGHELERDSDGLV